MTTSEAQKLIGKQCEYMRGEAFTTGVLTIIGVLEPVGGKDFVLVKGFTVGHNGESSFKYIAGGDDLEKSSTSIYVELRYLRILNTKGYKKSKKKETLFKFEDL
jgi:hypothetical protein